jgi:hypothetical protein
MNMTNTFKVARWILASPIVAAVLSTSAFAEYRCASPEQLTDAETRACELAQHDSPDALIHFVNQTKGIYNLYPDDYVSQADVERWDLAKRSGDEDSPAIAKAKSDSTDALKTE